MKEIYLLLFLFLVKEPCYSQKLQIPEYAQVSFTLSDWLRMIYTVNDAKRCDTISIIEDTVCHRSSYPAPCHPGLIIHEKGIYKNQRDTWFFFGHKYFSDSLKGRLERFSSVSLDGKSLREISHRFFFHFENEQAARNFIEDLSEDLKTVAEQCWRKATDSTEQFSFAADLRPDRYEREINRYYQIIVFTLFTSKSRYGYEVLVSDN